MSYGPVIVDGRVRYTSASALTTADPDSYGGCPRRWWLKYVLGLKEPTTAAMLRGTKDLHEPVENYYKTGAQTFTPLAMQVKRYLYPREWFLDGRLLIENEIGKPPGSDRPIDLETAPVRAAGIPLVGKLDQMHAQGIYINNEGAVITDVEWSGDVVEINDLKSTKSREFAKSPEELRKTVQMLSYAKFGIAWRPNARRFRPSHTYALTSGPDRDGFKHTVIMDREEVERRWERVDSIGRTISDLARETDINKVPANTKSCTAYGGCPHRKSRGGCCDAGDFNSLADRLGALSAQQLKEGTGIMGILSKGGITLPPTPQAPTTPAPTTTATATAPAGQSLADLLAAEAAAQAPAPRLDPRAIAAFDLLDAIGMGSPVLTGEAADARVEYTAIKTGTRMAYTPGTALGGSGRLAGLTAVSTVEGVIALAEQLKAHAQKHAAAQAAQAPAAPPPPAPTPVATLVGVLPPDAPASNPALAAKPPEGYVTNVPAEPAPSPLVAVQSNPTAAVMVGVAENATAPAPTAEAPAEPAKEKRKPGRPANPKPVTLDKPAEGVAATEPASDVPFELYINAVPSTRFGMLDLFIAKWHAALVATFKKSGVPLVVDDIRTAPNECKALAFGAWKGTASAMGAEMVREGALPRGRYVVFTNGDELTAAFVNGLVASGEFDNIVRGGAL